MGGCHRSPGDRVADPTQAELQNMFDFLEIKRGEKLGCWLCGHNTWSARKVENVESGVPVTYMQLICKNCRWLPGSPTGSFRGRDFSSNTVTSHLIQGRAPNDKVRLWRADLRGLRSGT